MRKIFKICQKKNIKIKPSNATRSSAKLHKATLSRAKLDKAKLILRGRIVIDIMHFDIIWGPLRGLIGRFFIYVYIYIP